MTVALAQAPSGQGDSYHQDIAIDGIRIDQRAQPRDHLNTEITEAYAEEMRAGATFPPLVVFHDGNDYWLADGFHRHYAAQGAALKTLRCEVRQGGLREAILYSCGANAVHGHRRTNEDKRRAVRRMLEDDDWRQWSDREIARQCNVAHPFVGRLRVTMAPIVDTGNDTSMPDDGQRTFVHHKTGEPAQMDTAAIGKPNGGSLRKGPKVNVPDGMKASDVCRQALEHERNGGNPDTAAKAIGVGVQSYRQMRDIVLLADRNDLGANDTALVKDALAALDDTRQPAKPHERIQHLVVRIWGAQGGQRSGSREAQRVEMFKKAISVIVEACETGSEINIPHLGRDQVDAALKELVRAEANLRALKSKIEETRQ